MEGLAIRTLRTNIIFRKYLLCLLMFIAVHFFFAVLPNFGQATMYICPFFSCAVRKTAQEKVEIYFIFIFFIILYLLLMVGPCLQKTKLTTQFFKNPKSFNKSYQNNSKKVHDFIIFYPTLTSSLNTFLATRLMLWWMRTLVCSSTSGFRSTSVTWWFVWAETYKKSTEII